MAESTLTAEVATLAERIGFHCWPLNQTRAKPKFTMKRGVADIVMFGHGVCLWVETKVDRNKQSEAQKEFEHWATGNGSLYWVCRSTDEFITCCKAKGWIR